MIYEFIHQDELIAVSIEKRDGKIFATVQENLYELTFNIVKDENFSDDSIKALADCVTKCFGQSMKCNIVFVEKIPLTERGKYQFSICKLADSDVPR